MKNLSSAARLYVWSVLVLAAAAFLWSVASLPMTRDHWSALAVLLACAAAAQLFPVVTPKNHAYYVTTVFFFAGLLLLPAAGLVILIVIAFVPEWIKTRYPWYVQTFNIANCLVSALLSRNTYLLAGGTAGGSLESPRTIAAALVAAIVFTLINHVLLAGVLTAARGHTWRESGLFEVGNLITDGALACTGVVSALLWQVNPWLLSLIGAPLFLIYRALNTPGLLELARTDSKTGLYNARHFYEELNEELCRAGRFQRPLAVVIADMDLLRNINNTYGHLAGDIVLKGVADTIKRSLREYDLAARFGGEEFAIILPETDANEALAVAERIRKEVESARFIVPTSVKPIRATLSLGVASFPTHGSDANEIIHQADLAVYYAKLRGRNRAWICSPESRALGPTLASGRLIDLYPEMVSKAQPSPLETTPLGG